MQMIEQLESRTLFSAAVVLGDVTDVNIEAAYVKQAFKSIKSYSVSGVFTSISGDLGSSLKAEELSAKEYRDAIKLVLGLNSDLRTKYADLATSGKDLLNTVSTDIAQISADVKSVAAKPKNASLRKQLKADIDPLAIAATYAKELDFVRSLDRIKTAANTALDQVAALDSKGTQTQSDIGVAEDEIPNGMNALRVQIGLYFTAVNHFISDAKAFA
jgi:uncharacterized phage infection (PIP) family protein YhgE